MASFASYAIEKRFSKRPEEFGKGAIEGVAGPESANNAGAGGQFIPLLTLGIPASPVMALMLGALVIFGLQPGPLLMTRSPDLFWGVIISMYIGNIMLLVLNLPAIGLWVQVLRIPYPFLFPLILLFCLIGSYSLSNNKYDVLIMVIFGVIGYLMKKSALRGGSSALGHGPGLDDGRCHAAVAHHVRGELQIFISRPISAGFILAAVALLAIPILRGGKKLLIDKIPETED